VKLAIVSPYALDRHGGVQEQALQLREQLTRIGHSVTLVGPGRSDGTWTSVGGITDIESNDAVAPVCLEPGAIQRVKEAIGGAEVVHVHEPLLPVVGPAAWIGAETPTVGTFHAEPAAVVRAVYKFGGPLLAHLVERIDVLTAVSAEAATAVEGFAPGVEIVPNAVDVAGFTAQRRSAHRVAFVGRDDPRKGLDVLLGAWPVVERAVPDAELVVVGARRDDEATGIRFEGTVPDRRKREVLSSSSVFCAPNTGGESFGITLVEAMAAGCAVVSTDLPAFVSVAGGVAEQVPVNDPVRLAQALVELLTDPERVRRQGIAAKARANEFDWSRILPRWIELYEKAIERSVGRIKG
jgi:phosphatidylinositol alpha-mannosyltransferase